MFAFFLLKLSIKRNENHLLDRMHNIFLWELNLCHFNLRKNVKNYTRLLDSIQLWMTITKGTLPETIWTMFNAHSQLLCNRIFSYNKNWFNSLWNSSLWVIMIQFLNPLYLGFFFKLLLSFINIASNINRYFKPRKTWNQNNSCTHWKKV